MECGASFAFYHQHIFLKGKFESGMDPAVHNIYKQTRWLAREKSFRERFAQTHRT